MSFPTSSFDTLTNLLLQINSSNLAETLVDVPIREQAHRELLGLYERMSQTKLIQDEAGRATVQVLVAYRAILKDARALQKRVEAAVQDKRRKTLLNYHKVVMRLELGVDKQPVSAEVKQLAKVVLRDSDAVHRRSNQLIALHSFELGTRADALSALLSTMVKYPIHERSGSVTPTQAVNSLGKNAERREVLLKAGRAGTGEEDSHVTFRMARRNGLV